MPKIVFPATGRAPTLRQGCGPGIGLAESASGSAVRFVDRRFAEQQARSRFHGIPIHAGRSNRVCKPGAAGQVSLHGGAVHIVA